MARIQVKLDARFFDFTSCGVDGDGLLGGRGHQVVHAVFNPFHGFACDDGCDDGTDIAGIDPDLVAKATTNIGRDNADIAFRDTRKKRCHGAHDVRCLEGALNRQLAVDLVLISGDLESAIDTPSQTTAVVMTICNGVVIHDLLAMSDQ